MAEDGNRLTGVDKRALILWVLLGVVGLVFAHRYFFRAFPEASVDFKVSRAEALDACAEICWQPGGGCKRIPVGDRFRRGRQREDLSGTRGRAEASEPADVQRTEHLVLECAVFPAAAGRRILRASEPRREKLSATITKFPRRKQARHRIALRRKRQRRNFFARRWAWI